MKKLTVGSLKDDCMKSNFSIEQAVKMEWMNGDEPNRVIEVKQNQRFFQVEVKKGQSILEAALEKNLAIDFKCKKGTCGKCKVQLLSGNAYLQTANFLEGKKLHHLIESGFRLACQARVR